MSVVIETTLGDITVDLFLKDRPQTCLNFLKLCKIKYYNLCLFHSVNSNFLAQTGDPTGKGDGGESIFGLLQGQQQRLFQAEQLPRLKHDQTGALSMVSHGNGLCGSQFLITLSPGLASLDQEHCVFGQVVEGVEVLLKLNEAITDEHHRPYQDIRITHTVVLEDPFPDPDGLTVPPASPVHPSAKDLAYSRIPADEPLTDNCSQQELDEMVQQREAAARAAILEMVGDLPDADAAPPENVLFVCKLNPVTSDHDLAIIFSRFGTVKSCEVIRDQVTGDSLQYAFVEFENRKACEDAYFKMDNVLIDDRRIHVDFSQSVAKLKWKGKGRGVEVLGPPPPGGWGGKGKEGKRKFDEHPKRDFDHKAQRRGYNERNDRGQRESQGLRNGKGGKEEKEIVQRKIKQEKKPVKKKEKMKIKRKMSESSSSSSSTETSSDSSSSSDSSDSVHRKKRKSRNRSRKVLVVVKTPRRSKTHKKPRKCNHKKYETDSDSESYSDSIKKKKKKAKRKYSSDDTSSSEEVEKKKKRKRRSASEDASAKRRRKKKAETSEESSEEEKKKKSRKRKAQVESSSESGTGKEKRRKKERVKTAKKKVSKKPKKRHRDSDSSSSSD